jgi:hypothetical protein
MYTKRKELNKSHYDVQNNQLIHYSNIYILRCDVTNYTNCFDYLFFRWTIFIVSRILIF